MSKSIGIVDITTVGSTICQLAIVEKSAEVANENLQPEFIVHSQPLHRYLQGLETDGWDKVADVALTSIDSLSKAGADFAIIPNNTAHYAFDKIQAHSTLPLLNLIDIAVEECALKQYKRVAVLGTSLTMQNGLYDTTLQNEGIIPVIPQDPLCNQINDLIFNELVPQKNKPQTVAALISELKNVKCDAYLLACTELPLVLNEHNLGPCINTTKLLGYKAVEFATNKTGL